MANEPGLGEMLYLTAATKQSALIVSSLSSFSILCVTAIQTSLYDSAIGVRERQRVVASQLQDIGKTGGKQAISLAA